jgi:formylglycine-generating enzyme required for sulfatase activity
MDEVLKSQASERTYADLEIRVLELQDKHRGYPVEITLNGEQEFPPGRLAPQTLPWVSTASAAEDGERLFAWLFADAELKMAWTEARGRWPRRRIRLRIDAAAPELHAIPWELLRDAETGPIAQDLAASVTTPFSRYIAGTWGSGRFIQKRPVKILVAIANPEGLADYDLAPLNIDDEWTAIQEATADPDVRLTLLAQPCTLLTLEAELKKGYHVLHLVGHGSWNRRYEVAALYLADQQDQVAIVRETEFAAMLARQLANVESQQDDALRLVFLASCQTATRSPADAFRGLAPALVAAGVPVVLAMQDLVSVKTAREFSIIFYQRLLQHGQVDLASNEARSVLLTGSLPGRSIPVLFSRLPDNQLLVRRAREIKHFEPETVFVPSGGFLMGSRESEGVPAFEMPQHVVHLPAYRIGKYPVTNEQYAEFIRQTRRLAAPELGWEGQTPPRDKPQHPVIGVTWCEAVAYCEWLNSQTGRGYSLPSEAQWEKAARGTDGRIYPWGDEWDPSRCHHGSDETVPVDAYPAQTVYGCYDMVGNAREWTSTLWGRKLFEPNPGFCYPWTNDHREDLTASRFILRVYRGGGATDKLGKLRCSARGAHAPDNPGPSGKRYGFRVVLYL